MGRNKWVVVAVVGLILAVGSSGCDDFGGSGASAGAELGCQHFANVISDFTKGILSTSETRQKAHEIYDDVEYADETDISDAGEHLLRAATADDGTDFLAAVGEMDDACDAAGAYK